MNALEIFDFEEKAIRMVLIDGAPWLIGKDVCNVLDIVNHRDALSRLDSDERGSVVVDTLGGQQNMSAVSESGLYHLIFQSRKQVAKRFRKWVTSEVLPALRKTGRYEAAPSLDIEDMREKMALVRETRLSQGKKAAQNMWQLLNLPDVSDFEEAPARIHDVVDGFIARFLSECTRENPSARVSSHDLWRAYEQWAAKNSAPSILKHNFGKRLTTLGCRKIKSSITYYCGIDLATDCEIGGGDV